MDSSQESDDEEVDFEQFRKAYESQDHWRLRKSFLIKFWDDFDDEQILLRNAQLFINIEMLECKYSDQTMSEIREMSNQVPEIRAYRQSRKNSLKLKRTLVCATFAVKAKYKKEVSTPNLKEAPEIEEIIKPIDWTDADKRDWNWESRSKEQNFQVMRLTDEQRMDNMRSLLKDVVVFDDLNGQLDLSKTSVNMKKLGKFEVTFDTEVGKYLYIFNDQIIGEGKGDGKKQAKNIADRMLETNLRNHCYSVRPKIAYFSAEDVIQRGDTKKVTPNNSDQLKEDNLGFRMLKALGWRGGTSLGPKNEGIIDPINLSIKIGRQGLGNDNPSFDAKYFNDLLKNFKQNQLEYDLIFSSDFKKEERARIHQ